MDTSKEWRAGFHRHLQRGKCFRERLRSMCMMHENKHVLATNLRACFGFLTLHKSTKLAERILTKEKLA